MNSKKYNELLEKYYQGLSSVEEERWLKEQETGSQQPLPLQALQTGQPAMDWSFDEMLQQASLETNLKTVPASPVVRWMKYAAAVAILLSASAVVYVNTERGNKSAPIITAYTPNPIPAQPKELADNPATPSTVSIVPAIKKGQRSKKITKNIPAPEARHQQEDNFLVLVDGRIITDESEALAILQQSFSRISGDIKETMTNINQSPKLDIKFK